MTRFGSLVLCASLCSGLCACGSNTSSTETSKNPLDLVPIDNAVSGWTVDQEHSKTPGTRAMTAGDKAEAVSLIDGGAEPFYKAPFTPKMFVWQNYINSTLPHAPPPMGAAIVLYVLEMPTADQASGLYASLLEESEYSGQKGTPDDWQPTSPLLGTESRIEDTRTAWWINFHQGTFYVEVMLSPSYGPAPDYTISDPELKAEALRFAQAVAAKM
jgi:hypothetical protein